MWNFINLFRNVPSLALIACSVSFSCLVNDTEELGSPTTLNISADSSKLHLQDLEAMSKYKFYLRCCTRVGCGPAVSEERTTVAEASEYGWQLFRGGGVSRESVCGIPKDRKSGFLAWMTKLLLLWASTRRMQATLFRPLISPSFSYAHLSISL